MDFFGLNCYNRVLDCADAAVDIRSAGGNYLDNGSELYPKAIYDAIHILNDEFKIGIPIYITENGTSNCNEAVVDGKVHDQQRIEYVRSFLEWIKKAIDEGADIRGYYLWSFLDNWEWSAGYTSRFGLTHVDYETQQRIFKDSAYFYQEVIRQNKLPETL